MRSLLLVLGLLAIRPVAAAVHDLAPVDAFHYQLQNLDVAAASASPFPVLVTDYSLDGSAAGELTPAEVTSLKSGGRVVLAYLSIGEAERYRFYWNPAWIDQGPSDPDKPSWLGPFNPSFRDNYEVRYWDPAWQAIIFGSPGAYLDRIIAQGFDGAYLDIVDGYEFWGPDGNGERPTAADDMRTFVASLAAYARTFDPTFAIVPQNGSALVSDPTYLAAISGQGGEDTWFNGNRQQRFQPADVVPFFDIVRAAGKAVLLIDYPTRSGRIDEFFDRAEARGYGAYNSTRGLDHLTLHPAHPPSPAPSVTLVDPPDAATVSASVPPTFEWSATGASGYEIHFSGTSYFQRVTGLPRRRGTLVTGTSFVPTLRDWQRVARETRRGDGATLYWWVVAVDAVGGRRSAAFRSLTVTP